LDFEVPTLKSINLKDNWQNRKAAIAAKIQTPGHLEKIECYGCHSAWAPQCYGCHVKVDFSGSKTATDWVAAGNTHFPDGHTAESMRGVEPPKAPGVAYGKTSENRSYLRWENPVLGINGEGRIGPIIPGCQQITTVVSPEGETLIHNKIWRTAPGVEGGGDLGQRGLDMAPAAPHTTDRQARECVSCHATSKALGFGTHDGRYLLGYANGIYVDIMNEKGQLVTKTAKFQISPVPDLPMDLDQIVSRKDEQLQTVGHHWPLDGPLTKDQREHMERVGVCLSCHKAVPTGAFAYRVLSRAGSVLNLIPKTDEEHQQLVGRALYLAANVEVFGGIILASIVAFLVLYFVFRKKKKA
jgi:hypothetical protein